MVIRVFAVSRAKCYEFELVSGEKRTPIVGAYLPPSTLEHLEDLETAFNRFSGHDVVLMRDLNVDLDVLGDERC